MPQFLTMEIQDYDELCVLWNKTPGITLSAADSRESIEAYLKRNPGQSFICRHQGKLIGSVLCGNDGRRAFLYHMAVEAEFCGQGIGSQLLIKAIEAQAARHIDKCALFVLKENDSAISFWQHAGFMPVCEAVTMAKNLS